MNCSRIYKNDKFICKFILTFFDDVQIIIKFNDNLIIRQTKYSYFYDDTEFINKLLSQCNANENNMILKIKLQLIKYKYQFMNQCVLLFGL